MIRARLKMFRLLPVLAAALIAGCASAPPFPAAGVDAALTPKAAVQAPQSALGRTVVWGGTIVRSRNLAHSTRLEVLAYPLDGGQRPESDKPAEGRFLVDKPGYLETVDYAPGRRVTVHGTVRGVHRGAVGRMPYRFPVVVADGLHLWPQGAPGSGSRIHFGVGVGVGVH